MLKSLVAKYEIALAGNPNVGKSTVFNELTGLNQHTGNWTGKTVENAVGFYEYQNDKIKVVDLPGTYSLLSNSEEEEIARNYICFEEPNLIVVVADATSLERNLNIYYQISEITDNVVLCVNLIDEAIKKKIRINKRLLENELGTKVIFTAARNNLGMEQLKNIIKEEINGDKRSKEIRYSNIIEEALIKISKIIKIDNNKLIDEKKLRWISLRLLEGNVNIVQIIVKKYSINENIINSINKIRNYVLKKTNRPIGDLIVENIVNISEDIANKVVKSEDNITNMQRRIDKILVSKKYGIPVMMLLFLLILWITITLANYPSQLLSGFFSWLEGLIRTGYIYQMFPLWLSGILIDGVYITLAWVISVMLPPMAIFFPMFTLLEDLGYLPRIAFNLDRCFKKCGSCGKQALTMCMGVGCNAVGVTGCRIINSKRERLIAILTNSFMPCNGRFPTLITISSIFLGGGIAISSGNIIASVSVTLIILIGILMTLIISKILSSTILKGIPSSFILELPPYRKPQILKTLVRALFDRTINVLGRAIAVAAPTGAVIWIFANIKLGDTSILVYVANVLQPFGEAIGLDGYIILGFILGLPANEIVMPIIIMSYLKAPTMLEINNLANLKTLLVENGWTILTAINMLIMCLMHYPCGTTLWTIKRETGSIKWTVIAFLIPTIIGVSICFLIKQIYNLI